KRRLSKKQTDRIQRIQQNYHTPSSMDVQEQTFEGRVITRFGRHAEIETQDGIQIHCALRPNLPSIVAGDQVLWQPSGKHQGIIVHCLPRRTLLERTSKHGQKKLIAANVTQLMIVVAPEPEITWSLLDSYLVIAEYLQLQACIVLNKID